MSGIELYAPRIPKHRRTWTAFAIILVLVFIIVGQAATVLGLLKPLGFHSNDPANPWQAMAITLAGFGFSSLLVFLWAFVFERRLPDTLGFNSKGLARYRRGLLIGFSFITLVVTAISVLGGYKLNGQGIWSAPTLGLITPLLVLFVGFMIQGATEEILLRGWLMQLVASRHGVVLAIIINSTLFSLLHAGNISPSKELVVGLLNIVLVAIFLSLYAIKEGSLWGVCAWHCAWNWLLGVGFGLKVSGETINASPLIVYLTPKDGAAWWLTGGAFGPEASVVTSVILVAGIAYQIANKAYQPAEPA